jgi:hypothetical protein
LCGASRLVWRRGWWCSPQKYSWFSYGLQEVYFLLMKN